MNGLRNAVAIVDSDATTPHVLAQTLERLFAETSFDIVVYPTIDKAKQRLDDPTNPVDLWMVDGGRVGGVDVNGFCAVLKARKATFLRMTGHPGHVQEGLEGTPLGMEEVAVVLLKPFELRDLQARVQAFILAKPVGI